MSTELFRHKPNRGERGDNAANTPPEVHEILPPPSYAPNVMGRIATSEAAAETGWWRRLSLKTRIGVGGLALATAIGGGIALANGGGEHAPTKKPTADAPAVPGEASPSPSETHIAGDTEYLSPNEVQPPKSVTNSAEFEALAPAEQAKIKEYDAMTIEQFNQLSVDDQLLYSQFYVDVYKPYAEQQIKKKIALNTDFVELLEPDELSSGQDVLDQYSENQAVAMWSLSPDGNPYHIDEARKLNVEKVLSLSYDPNEPSGTYRSAVDILQKTDGLTYDPSYPNRSDQYIHRTAMEESTVFDAKNSGAEERDGYKEPTIIINALSNAKTPQDTFTMKRFTDAQGKDRNVWRLTDQKLQDGATHYLTNEELEAIGQ